MAKRTKLFSILALGFLILTLPIFTSPLPGHLFAPFRRIGQRMLYAQYFRRDERP